MDKEQKTRVTERRRSSRRKAINGEVNRASLSSIPNMHIYEEHFTTSSVLLNSPSFDVD